MTSMLRSQGIPTKLQIGYAGKVYHAWISVYLEETGWIDDIIQFDGKHWERMDPTFAYANANSKKILNYNWRMETLCDTIYSLILLCYPYPILLYERSHINYEAFIQQ